MIGPASLVLAAAMLMAAGDNDAPQPFHPGQKGVTYPQVLKAPLPVYPEAATRAGVEATVRVSFVVGAEGYVDEVDILASSLGPGAPQAARDAVRKVGTGAFEEAVRKAFLRRRYAPAMRQGHPVPVRMETTVIFSTAEREALRRWQQVESGLHALADARIIPAGAHVAGRDGVGYPIAVKQRAPVQPHGARIRGIRSRVALLLLVDADGEVADIPLMRAEKPGQGFDEAAERAIRGWRFAPARKDGEAVAAYHWLEVTIPSR